MADLTQRDQTSPVLQRPNLFPLTWDVVIRRGKKVEATAPDFPVLDEWRASGVVPAGWRPIITGFRAASNASERDRHVLRQIVIRYEVDAAPYLIITAAVLAGERGGFCWRAPSLRMSGGIPWPKVPSRVSVVSERRVWPVRKFRIAVAVDGVMRPE